MCLNNPTRIKSIPKEGITCYKVVWINYGPDGDREYRSPIMYYKFDIGETHHVRMKWLFDTDLRTYRTLRNPVKTPKVIEGMAFHTLKNKEYAMAVALDMDVARQASFDNQPHHHTVLECVIPADSYYAFEGEFATRFIGDKKPTVFPSFASSDLKIIKEIAYVPAD
jgi:hypothetical protein